MDFENDDIKFERQANVLKKRVIDQGLHTMIKVM